MAAFSSATIVSRGVWHHAKLYVLQGLPGIGPALAQRLLARFGSVERVITADEAALMQVRGIGRTTAMRIRERYASKQVEA